MATSRWQRLAQNLALSLGVFLLCVGVFELLLRLNGYGNLEIYEPDPALYWKLKPNQDCYTKVDHKPVHINSHGTRGREFQTEKPTNSFRILSLGDSRTFGWGLSEGETYSGILESLLQKEAPAGKRIEGHRTRFIPIDPKQDPLFKEQQQAEPDALFHAAIESLCRLAQDRGVKPVLLYLPALDEARATNSPAVLTVKRDISRRLNLPLVDLISEVQASGDSLYLQADPVHFNAAGNATIARQLLEIVRPLAAQ